MSIPRPPSSDLAGWLAHPATKRELLAKRIRARRDEVQNNGHSISVPGYDPARKWWTDAKSVADMTGKSVQMAKGGMAQTPWSGDGWAGVVGIAEFDAAGLAVGAFVDSTFIRRGELFYQLANTEDADLDAFAAVVEAFWPAS